MYINKENKYKKGRYWYLIRKIMNRDYIIKPMSELINNANQVDRIPLSSFNKMIGNPEKVEDFL